MSSTPTHRGRPADRSSAGHAITSIPLTDPKTGEPSIGDLVSDATAAMSTLVRSEVELAKAELFGEIKKAAIGSVFFAVALAVLLFGSFYFFFFIAELLAVWLPRWAAFGIVCLTMIVVALAAAGLGVWRMTKVHAPRKTIGSIKQVADVLPAMPGRGHVRHTSAEPAR